MNIFVCKGLRLFLTYTVLLVSSRETSQPQHIIVGDCIGVSAFMLPTDFGYFVFSTPGSLISILFTSTAFPIAVCCGVTSFMVGCGSSPPFVYPSRGYEAATLCHQRFWRASVVWVHVRLLYDLGWGYRFPFVYSGWVTFG